MLYKVFSAAVFGIKAYLVHVEVNGTYSPSFSLLTVGLPDTAIKESKERVRAALKNCGFDIRQEKFTVNLAPANIRKEGSSFDLPVAVGILGTSKGIRREHLDDFLLLGELSLDGAVRPVRGALSVALMARSRGIRSLLVPEANASEAAVVEGVAVYPARNLSQVVELLNAEALPPPVPTNRTRSDPPDGVQDADFREVRGQHNAKRSLEVAAAGGHNILMIGPPGSGKTMLAKRIPTILPPPTFEEALETTQIHSVSLCTQTVEGLVSRRPFRAPHHTISDAGLIGGGSVPRPGEVSLAHNGVLFLDELPEFDRRVLEVLRQPLEDGTVSIARAAAVVDFPARFMLAAAMNPCPCGFFGSSIRNCSCTPPIIQRYISRISGPLLDRIDLHIDVPEVKFREMASAQPGEDSLTMRNRVVKARQIQLQRFQGKGLFCNAQMPPRLIRKHCLISPEGQKKLESAMSRLGLSARAHDRVLKVARTIADLAGHEEIRSEHVSEAIQYRTLDRNLWV